MSHWRTVAYISTCTDMIHLCTKAACYMHAHATQHAVHMRPQHPVAMCFGVRVCILCTFPSSLELFFELFRVQDKLLRKVGNYYSTKVY